MKNLAEEAEGWRIAEALLRERLAARDLMLAHLGRQRDVIEDDGPRPLISSRRSSTRLSPCSAASIARSGSSPVIVTHRLHPMELTSTETFGAVAWV